MFARVLTGGAATALACASMLAISASSASAFTLSAPSLEQPVVASQIDRVWWDNWGRWHPDHPHWGPHWGPGPGWGPPPGPPPGPWGWGHRHCWQGQYRMHCD
jgi:hypothetical protein